MTNTEFKTGVIAPIECVKQGFELIKRDYWLLFAIALVGGLIGGVTMYILGGAMICGIFISYLNAIDGRRVTFDDLWVGMKYFAPGLIVMLVIVVPMIVFYVSVYAVAIAAIVAGQQLGEEGLIALFVGVGIVELVFLIAMICFHTLLMFSFPLIVDRNVGGIDAIKVSASAVWQNLSGVVGLIVVNFGLMLIGYAALCFGVYFVIPIMIAGNAVAYRRVFPSLHSRPEYSPPPPDTYKWQ